jgi:hypothetical protein
MNLNVVSDLYVMQQFHTLLTYGQMSYFTVPHGVFDFQSANGSGPPLEDLNDGACFTRTAWSPSNHTIKRSMRIWLLI